MLILIPIVMCVVCCSASNLSAFYFLIFNGLSSISCALEICFSLAVALSCYAITLFSRVCVCARELCKRCWTNLIITKQCSFLGPLVNTHTTTFEVVLLKREVGEEKGRMRISVKVKWIQENVYKDEAYTQSLASSGRQRSRCRAGVREAKSEKMKHLHLRGSEWMKSGESRDCDCLNALCVCVCCLCEQNR